MSGWLGQVAGGPGGGRWDWRQLASIKQPFRGLGASWEHFPRTEISLVPDNCNDWETGSGQSIIERAGDHWRHKCQVSRRQLAGTERMLRLWWGLGWWQVTRGIEWMLPCVACVASPPSQTSITGKCCRAPWPTHHSPKSQLKFALHEIISNANCKWCWHTKIKTLQYCIHTAE